MRVKAVIGVKSKDVGLIGLLKVLNIEGALIHIEVPLFLLVLGVDAAEVDQTIALRDVVSLNCYSKMTLMGEALD